MTRARGTAKPDAAGRPVIVLIPGALETAAAVAAAGLEDALGAQPIDIELQIAELEMAHMTDRAIVGRLVTRVREARARGAPAVWLAGISLGALFALAVAERYPGEVDGLCLIAPYLGTRILTGEIARAGGARAWAATAAAVEDEEHRVWRYLGQGGLSGLPLFVGLADGDRFADSQYLLKDLLPSDAIDCVHGGHDWPTWRALWERFVARWPLDTAAGPARATV
jgi:pimeloyl-ACP methyl ester carboxylesterase